MMIDGKLSKNDLRLFKILWDIVSGGRPIPSQSELALMLGIQTSRAVVGISMTNLHELGLIFSPPGKFGSGRTRKVEIIGLRDYVAPVKGRKKPLITAKTPSEEKTAPLAEAVDCCATCFYWSYSRASYHECRGNQTPNAGRDPLRICHLFLRRI
jgi:hypothetical protein